MLNGLDLFSGIGGLSLALSDWVCPIAYCENDPYAQSVLLSRMEKLQLPVAPIWDDVRTLCREAIRSDIDVIYGGFPCQDISVAGLRKGLVGERSGLFWEIVRLTEECSPAFVFLENVWPGVSSHVDTITASFKALGYYVRDGVLSAQDVGANHIRQRWFMLATDSKRGELRDELWRCRGESREEAPEPSIDCEKPWRPLRPEICGMDDGIPARVDRLRALGNAVVPLQAREAFKRLMGLRGP